MSYDTRARVADTLEAIEFVMHGGSPLHVEMLIDGVFQQCPQHAHSWNTNAWYRLRKPPEARPWSDPMQCLGKIIKQKNGSSKTAQMITTADDKGCSVNNSWLAYDILLLMYVQVDGSPCGVLDAS